MAVNRAPRESSRGGPKRQHRKVCSFCVEKIHYIDYKEISRLRRLLEGFDPALFTGADTAPGWYATLAADGEGGAATLSGRAQRQDFALRVLPSRLRRFVSDRGKILPRRVTGTCARHQRPLTTALERARAIALLPYTTEQH